jgi:pimeloyl-ACP methyl ester carboxylesterase
MATYALIHGAGSDSWYWHLVTPLLRARGHEVIAPDLPCDDDSAGLAEYTDVVVNAIGKRSGVILVAQSMAGFTAPLVSTRVKVSLIALVAAMIPAPGESPGAWWANTGHTQARRDLDIREGRDPDAEFDGLTTFMHDLPRSVIDDAMAHGAKNQSATPFKKPWPLAAWPNVPTRFLLCLSDRFFPADFMRRIVGERLGIVPDEIDSGHLPALSRPKELVEWLERCRREAAVQ